MALLKKVGIVVFYIALLFAGHTLYLVYHDNSRAKPVREDNLPDTFPLMLAWYDGGEEHCQAFFADEITKVEKIYPSASFAVHDFQKCEFAVRFFEQNNGLWPVQFKWQSRANWPYITYSFTKNADGEAKVEVTYNRDDDDHYNKARYRIRGGKVLEAEHILSYGPAMAASAIISGLALLLGVLTIHLLHRYFKRKRRGSL